MQFVIFSEYTLTVTFLNGSNAFQFSNQYVFASCVFFGDKDQGLDQSCRTLINNQYLVHMLISAGVEWVPGWFSWLRIISSTSLMLCFVHTGTDIGTPEPSFQAT